MRNFQKQFKKYQRLKKRSAKKNKTIENKKTYFDKLYIRIFLSSFLLLIMILLNNIYEINFINYNYNIIPLLNILTNHYDINTDLPVNLETIYEKIDYLNGINYIKNTSFNGVVSTDNGIVVSIKKQDNLYYVTIIGENDLEYTYGGLESIDVTIYMYITSDKIIGSCPKVNDYYTFTLEIKKEDVNYNILLINNE